MPRQARGPEPRTHTLLSDDCHAVGRSHRVATLATCHHDREFAVAGIVLLILILDRLAMLLQKPFSDGPEPHCKYSRWYLA